MNLHLSDEETRKRLVGVLDQLGTAFGQQATISDIITEVRASTITNGQQGGVVGASIGSILGGILGSIIPGLGIALGGLIGGGTGALVEEGISYAIKEGEKSAKKEEAAKAAASQPKKGLLSDLNLGKVAGVLKGSTSESTGSRESAQPDADADLSYDYDTGGDFDFASYGGEGGDDVGPYPSISFNIDIPRLAQSTAMVDMSDFNKL